MITAQTLIDSAGRLIGVVADGESMSATESANALQVLNDLLDSLSLEELSAFAINAAAYNLTPNKQTYTIGIDPTGGTTADFSVARPTSIENANIISNTSGTPLRTPLQMVNDDEWAAIRVLSVPTTIPQKLYVSPGYPFTSLSLWPYPTVAYQIELYTLQTLNNIASLGTNILFPGGYQRMLRYMLAVELAPEYGKPVDPAIVQIALDAKRQVQSRNAEAPLMKCDPSVLGKRFGGGFNYLTGGY